MEAFLARIPAIAYIVRRYFRIILFSKCHFQSEWNAVIKDLPEITMGLPRAPVVSFQRFLGLFSPVTPATWGTLHGAKFRVARRHGLHIRELGRK